MENKMWIHQECILAGRETREWYVHGAATGEKEEKHHLEAKEVSLWNEWCQKEMVLQGGRDSNQTLSPGKCVTFK